MEIDLQKNIISVHILPKDKEKINKLGFSWNAKDKVWYKSANIYSISAVEVEYIRQLEIKYQEAKDEYDDHIADLEGCKDEIY